MSTFLVICHHFLFFILFAIVFTPFIDPRLPFSRSTDVYIVSYARTPLTNAFTGSLSGYTAPQLAGFAINGKPTLSFLHSYQ